MYNTRPIRESEVLDAAQKKWIAEHATRVSKGNSNPYPNPVPSHPFTYKPTLDAVKWLMLATSKPSAIGYRPILEYRHLVNGDTYSADGYRVHVVRGTDLAAANGTALDGMRVPDFSIVFPRSFETTVKVSRYHLTRAVFACSTFARESSNITRLSVNGSLQISASSVDTGDCVNEIRYGDVSVGAPKYVPPYAIYTHTGENLLIAFNRKYLLDALSGMPELVELCFNSQSQPMVIRGVVEGLVRECCVMPMHIGQ